MPASIAATQFNGGGGGDYTGVVGAYRSDLAQPYYQAYHDDQFFYQPIAVQGTIHPGASQAVLESYYKYLPPLTRGKVVPDGYPTQYAGFYLAPNFFPRINPLDFRQGPEQKFTTTNPRSSSWDEAFVAANPGILKLPASFTLTVAQVLADKGTVVVQKDSKGKPCGWWSARWRTYISYAPHLLFDRLLRSKRIFADPTAYYWQAKYSAWLQPSYRESLRNFAEAVVVALAIAYVAGAAGIDGSAGLAGGGGASGGGAIEATSVTDAAPAGEVAAPVSTSVEGSSALGTTLAPVDSGLAVGGSTAAAAGGGASLLSQASGAAAILKPVESLAASVGKALGLVKPPVAQATKATTTAQGGSTTPAPAPSGLAKWIVGGGALALAVALIGS